MCRDHPLCPFRHGKRGTAHVVKLREHVGHFLPGEVCHPAAMLVEGSSRSNTQFCNRATARRYWVPLLSLSCPCRGPILRKCRRFVNGNAGQCSSSPGSGRRGSVYRMTPLGKSSSH